MKLRGYMTVEAAYVFAALIFVVAGLIKLNFYLHNSLLSDVCKIVGGIKFYQAESFYYDVNTERINTEEICNSPIFGESKSFAQEAEEILNKSVSKYYLEKRLSIENELSDAELDEIMDIQDNANLIRASGRAVQIIGGVLNED